MTDAANEAPADPGCRDCVNAHTITDGKGNAAMMCRRYPPVVHLVPVGGGLANAAGQMQLAPMSFFPQVGGDWICGEYMGEADLPDEDKAA